MQRQRASQQLEGDHRIERLDEETVRAEIEKMNAAWGNWRFEVGKWRIATADKRVSDFLNAQPSRAKRQPAATNGTIEKQNGPAGENQTPTKRRASSSQTNTGRVYSIRHV